MLSPILRKFAVVAAATGLTLSAGPAQAVDPVEAARPQEVGEAARVDDSDTDVFGDNCDQCSSVADPDGVPDFQDLDSDNDAIYDLVESINIRLIGAFGFPLEAWPERQYAQGRQIQGEVAALKEALFGAILGLNSTKERVDGVATDVAGVSTQVANLSRSVAGFTYTITDSHESSTSRLMSGIAGLGSELGADVGGVSAQVAALTARFIQTYGDSFEFTIDDNNGGQARATLPGISQQITDLGVEVSADVGGVSAQVANLHQYIDSFMYTITDGELVSAAVDGLGQQIRDVSDRIASGFAGLDCGGECSLRRILSEVGRVSGKADDANLKLDLLLGGGDGVASLNDIFDAVRQAARVGHEAAAGLRELTESTRRDARALSERVAALEARINASGAGCDAAAQSARQEAVRRLLADPNGTSLQAGAAEAALAVDLAAGELEVLRGLPGDAFGWNANCDNRRGRDKCSREEQASFKEGQGFAAALAEAQARLDAAQAALAGDNPLTAFVLARGAWSRLIFAQSAASRRIDLLPDGQVR